MNSINDAAILHEVRGDEFIVSILEWDWPDVVDCCLRQDELAVEMPIVPYASTATANFPELAPSEYCPMGGIFIRYPGHVIRGRGQGGKIRLLRWEFLGESKADLLHALPEPDLEHLQKLLSIRSQTLKRALEIAAAELQFSRADTLRILSALHTIVSIEVRRLLEEECLSTPQRSVLPDWQFSRVRQILAARGAQTTVAELAQACGISSRHLGRQFMRLTGCTVSNYLRSYCIERAKELLCSSEMSVAEVARAVHFTSTGAFTRAFRRLEHTTPLQYRQRSRQLVHS